MKGKISQKAAVMLVIVIVAAIVGGAVGYAVKPTPTTTELEARISELESTVSTQQSTISAQQSRISELEAQLAGVTTTTTTAPAPVLRLALLNHCGPTVPIFVTAMTTAKIAAESLGCSVTEYYAAGDLSAQAGKVAEFGAAGYDIIITTIPDPYLFDDPIASAIANGSTVLGWVDDDYTPNPRQAFVGWENNVRCGQKFASIILPLSPGSRIVYASEDIGATWNHDRHIGLMEALSGMDVNVDVVDLTRDYAVGEERLGSYLEAHPDVVAIVGGDGMGTEVAVKVLESKNIPPGQIKVTGHCMSELSIRGIEEGYIEKAMAASPQTVAQTVVMMAYMMREHGVMGITLEVPWVFVAAEDVPWLKAAYVLPG